MLVYLSILLDNQDYPYKVIVRTATRSTQKMAANSQLQSQFSPRI